jgi:hypothetical protein
MGTPAARGSMQPKLGVATHQLQVGGLHSMEIRPGDLLIEGLRGEMLEDRIDSRFRHDCGHLKWLKVKQQSAVVARTETRDETKQARRQALPGLAIQNSGAAEQGSSPHESACPGLPFSDFPGQKDHL